MSKGSFAKFNDSSAKDYDHENRGIPRLFARLLVSILPELSPSLVVHDNACGPAVVTSEIHRTSSDATTQWPKIVATDLSEPSISVAKTLAETNGWQNVEAAVMDSMDLRGIDDGTFDISITNFGIFSDFGKAAAEVYRTLKSGGVGFLTVWKFHGFLDLLRRISDIVRPEVAHEGHLRGKFMSKDAVVEMMMKAGFKRQGVEVQEHREWLRFEDEQDLKVFMTTGKIAQFTIKGWEEDQKEMIPAVLSQALTDDERRLKAMAMDGWVITAKKT